MIRNRWCECWDRNYGRIQLALSGSGRLIMLQPFSAPSEEFYVGDLRRWKVISIKLKCIFKLIVLLLRQTSSVRTNHSSEDSTLSVSRLK